MSADVGTELPGIVIESEHGDLLYALDKDEGVAGLSIPEGMDDEQVTAAFRSLFETHDINTHFEVNDDSELVFVTEMTWYPL